MTHPIDEDRCTGCNGADAPDNWLIYQYTDGDWLCERCEDKK